MSRRKPGFCKLERRRTVEFISAASGADEEEEKYRFFSWKLPFL